MSVEERLKELEERVTRLEAKPAPKSKKQRPPADTRDDTPGSMSAAQRYPLADRLACSEDELPAWLSRKQASLLLDARGRGGSLDLLAEMAAARKGDE
jgi:hypothetical protein